MQNKFESETNKLIRQLIAEVLEIKLILLKSQLNSQQKNQNTTDISDIINKFKRN